MPWLNLYNCWNSLYGQIISPSQLVCLLGGVDPHGLSVVDGLCIRIRGKTIFSIDVLWVNLELSVG